MTAPTDYRQAALAKALSQIDRAFGKGAPQTTREKASAFHKLAMDTLRPAINFRRQIWVREARGFGPSGSRFNAFELTPHTLALVARYRASAQRLRAQARREAAAQAQRVAA